MRSTSETPKMINEIFFKERREYIILVRGQSQKYKEAHFSQREQGLPRSLM